MTLPFRGRHHDAEASHDRARALGSEGLLQPLGEDDAAWLARHLEGCAECRSETDAWLADHQLLHALRDRTPEPPRDLWARTSAAIDREARGSRRRRTLTDSGRAAGRDVWRGLPLGAAAGALVVAIVVGSSIFNAPLPPSGTPGPTQFADITPLPQPTNLAIANAGRVGWIRQAEDGSWELVLSEVDEVCPRAKAGCEVLGEDSLARLNLGVDATGLTISPNDRQLVVQSLGDASKPGKVYVVPVPSASPTSTPTPPATEEPTGSGAVVTAPPASPGGSPIVTPSETPDTSPPGAIEIASGVTMVGEAAYSADGAWLAFSARPADDSAGPDLYIWHAGDAAATKVTDDHQTYFSTWHGGQVLASRVAVPAVVGPDATAEPGTSSEPSPEPTEATPGPGYNVASPGIPTSFLLDPSTLARTDLTEPMVWLPVVDPAGRFTAYWSGDLVPTPDGLDWQLGDGRLVLDEWLEPGDAPTASEAPTAAPEVTTDPDVTAAPSAAAEVVVGPAGRPVEIAVGDIATFQAKFDPDGIRIAVWAADEADALVGRLHLVVLDPATGTIDATVTPLPGAPALRRFSIDHGRLAWVSPRGQDGQESAVQVLGWSGRDFGEIKTIPAKDLFIVR